LKILFLYLDAFRQTGGIEKFNRAFMKALGDISNDKGISYRVISVYDSKPDTRYIEELKHTGFKGNKFFFAINSILQAFSFDTVVIGHLNLAPVGILIKLFKPNVKMILIAHGIEVWDKQPFIKSKFIKKADLILAVSNFTRDRILAHNKIPPEKIKIFPNTLDPFFKPPYKKEKPACLMKRYGLTNEDKIILTVTRINRFEGYKGYDKVLEALPELIKKIPGIKYILCGKYGPVEEARLKNLVKDNKLQDNFIFPGFINEEELIDHYLLADVFVLPSKKEGFGIVFIEAAACGVPVIAGNKDGSVDALMNGKIGKLIDPDNLDEIAKAIIDTIANPPSNNRDLLLENFSFEQFEKKLLTIMIEN
jgi:phosphatidylinositol alpha-1,6-mannosyltransferase